MTAPRRMALAFLCMLLSIASLGAISIISITIRSGLRHALPTIEGLPVFLLFALPGWVLVLPFVLIFKDADGWRSWTTLTIGTAIGPCFLLSWMLFSSRGSMTWNWQADGTFLLMSLLVGFLTAALYVLLLRRSKRKLFVLPQ